MVTAQYRVLAFTDACGGQRQAIHEVYYDRRGRVVGVSRTALSLAGEGEAATDLVLRALNEALRQPWLDGDQFGADGAGDAASAG